MLDPNYIRENTNKVKKGVGDRGLDPQLIDRWLELDERWRGLLQKVEKLREIKASLEDLRKEALVNLERISKPLPPFYKKVYSFFRGMLDIPDSRVGWFPFAYEVAKKTIEEDVLDHLSMEKGVAAWALVR